MSRLPTTYQPNKNQRHLLILLFKFRFATSTLLTTYKKVSSPVVINGSLKILLANKLMDRKYEKSYAIDRKAARYYLAKDAIQYLRESEGINPDALHVMHKNKLISDKTIDEHLTIFEVYMALERLYPNTFDIYTKYELIGVPQFPEKLPMLYLRRIRPSSTKPNDYLLDIQFDTRAYKLKQRLLQYQEHCDDAEWETQTDSPYPALLLVCPDGATERSALRRSDQTLDDEISLFTTTLRALKHSEAVIWTEKTELEKLVSL